MSTLNTLLEEIDTATAETCAQCDGSLDGSPSAYWCSQDCQEDWNALRAHALVGYREPLYTWATLGPEPEDFEDRRDTRVSEWRPHVVAAAAPESMSLTLTAGTRITFGDAQDLRRGIPVLSLIIRMRGAEEIAESVRRAMQAFAAFGRTLGRSGVVTESLPMTDSITWSADATVSEAFREALRPDPERVAQRHIEVCGDCSSRPDVDRHAARLGVEVVDLNQDSALSWPLHSMRTVVPEPQPPELTELTPALPVLPTSGPQQRHRAPRTLGRPR